MNLRIGHLSTAYHTAPIILRLKMLEKKGVTARWRLFGGGPPIVEAMEKDEIDIGYIGLPPAMIGIARQAPIKCVAGGHMEGTALCTIKKIIGAEKEIITGLQGMRIGSPPKGSIHDIIIRHLLNKYGVRSEVVNFPWADMIPFEIEERRIAAAVGTPALAVLLRRDLGIEITLPPNKLWPYNPSYGIIAREDLLDSRELKKFIEVNEEACNLIISSPKKAANLTAQVLGVIEPEFALDVIRLSPRYCAALPEEYINSTIKFVPAMIELGYLSKPLVIRDTFHFDIINDVHREENHYSQPLNL